MYIPKDKRDNKHFIGYTTNYGRKKGVKGSGGWGIVPNTVNGIYELTSENLKWYAVMCKFVYLCNGERYTLKDTDKI